MAFRELLIKIPEEKYDRFKQIASDRDFSKCKITELPKVHGRLGDLDALEKEMLGGINAGLMMEGYEDYPNINSADDCLELVKYADTIIEASHSI